jgi:peptidoglycan hydrolase-like protein with peptidoglycan-binding domain
MEKVNLHEGNAALERVLLMMKYDMNKTLNENKGFVDEQAQSAEAPKGFRNFQLGIYGAGGFGTDEQKLIDAFNELTTAKDFVDLENYLKTFFKRPNYTIQNALGAELGMGDANVAKQIQSKLKSLGINMDFEMSTSGVDVLDGTIRIQVPKESLKPKQSTECLSKIKQYKVAGKRGLYKIGQTNYKFYSTGQYTSWVGNGPKSTGKWVCDSKGFIDLGGKKLGGSKTPSQWVKAPQESEVSSGTKVLKSGMMGDFVGKVQNQLKAKGINPGTVDNKFGKNTKNAIMKFQESVGLEGDGVVEKNTYEQLFFEVPKVEPTNVTPQGETPAEQPDLNPVFEPKAPEIQRQQQTVDPLTPRQQRQANRMARRQQNAHVDPQPTIKESMKKQLKTKLVEKTKENENLVVETRIINKRLAILSEGITLKTEDDKINLVENISQELNYLSQQGYSSKLINEGLFSFLGSLFGGSVKSVPAVFGEYIAKWLTSKLGIPEGSYLQAAIIALVGNLNIADYDKLFTDCRFASNKIADSLIEAWLIQMQQKAQATSQGATGFITSAMRNAVADYLLEDKDGIVQKLQDMIGDFICPKLSKVASTLGDKAEEIKDKAMA